MTRLLIGFVLASCLVMNVRSCTDGVVTLRDKIDFAGLIVSGEVMSRSVDPLAPSHYDWNNVQLQVDCVMKNIEGVPIPKVINIAEVGSSGQCFDSEYALGGTYVAFLMRDGKVWIPTDQEEKWNEELSIETLVTLAESCSHIQQKQLVCTAGSFPEVPSRNEHGKRQGCPVITDPRYTTANCEPQTTTGTPIELTSPAHPIKLPTKYPFPTKYAFPTKPPKPDKPFILVPTKPSSISKLINDFAPPKLFNKLISKMEGFMPTKSQPLSETSNGLPPKVNKPVEKPEKNVEPPTKMVAPPKLLNKVRHSSEQEITEEQPPKLNGPEKKPVKDEEKFGVPSKLLSKLLSAASPDVPSKVQPKKVPILDMNEPPRPFLPERDNDDGWDYIPCNLPEPVTEEDRIPPTPGRATPPRQKPTPTTVKSTGQKPIQQNDAPPKISNLAEVDKKVPTKLSSLKKAEIDGEPPKITQNGYLAPAPIKIVNKRSSIEISFISCQQSNEFASYESIEQIDSE